MLLLLLGALTCSKATVNPTDLIGTWVVTDESRKRLPPAFQKAAVKIGLDANGGFFASQLPGEVLYATPEGIARLVTGSGVWKLGSREGETEVQLEFRTIEGASPNDVPFVTRLHVSVDRAPILFYYGGDPDEGVRIKFERK